MKREIILLENEWKFYLGDVTSAFYRGFDDTSWRTVTIPHDWAIEHPFSRDYASGTGYLPGGIAWYRVHFSLPGDICGKRVSVHFGGVYKNSHVWCNSNNLGKRPYGYSSFSYDISAFVTPGDNVICVRVSHEDVADSRWYTGSGIYRQVYIEISDCCAFEKYGVFFAIEKVQNQTAHAYIDWNSNDFDAYAEFKLVDDDGAVVAESGSVQPGQKAKMTIYNPQLWSPENPKLYTLRAVLEKNSTIRDEIEIPVGIRTISFDADKGFFINGRATKIKGVCLHHDAGTLGAAVPQDVWLRRLQKLKSMGCNAIRTSHNPPDSLLLDLCDRMGFLVVDEAFDEWEGYKNKWWQGHNVYPPQYHGYAEDFPVWHETDLAEMVCRDRNHPCIIMWSIGNEIDYPNDPYCSPLFKTMTGNNDTNKPAAERQYDPFKPDAHRLETIAKNLSIIVKKHDKSRPVTAALAFPELSNQIGYSEALDIVGYNYKEHLYKCDHEQYPTRVLYGSENGHSVDAWLAVRDHDYISGQFLWTGIDYMGEAEGWPVRAATPGLLTMAGFEKPKYYHRKAMWADRLFVRISAREAELPSTTTDGEMFSWNFIPGTKVYVYCYSNAYEVELFLNGRSLGVKGADRRNPGVFLWETVFEPGELKAVARRNNETATDNLVTAGEPGKINLSVVAPTENGRLLQVELTLTDAVGNDVYHKDMLVRWKCDNGHFLGTESGAPDDLIPYFETDRRTFYGKMIAYVMKDSAEVKCTVYASLPNGNGSMVYG